MFLWVVEFSGFIIIRGWMSHARCSALLPVARLLVRRVLLYHFVVCYIYLFCACISTSTFIPFSRPFTITISISEGIVLPSFLPAFPSAIVRGSTLHWAPRAFFSLGRRSASSFLRSLSICIHVMYEEHVIRGRIVHLPILWQVYLPRTLKYYTITDIQLNVKAGSPFLVSMYDRGSLTSRFLDVYDSDVRRAPDSFCRASGRYGAIVSKSRRRPFWVALFFVPELL